MGFAGKDFKETLWDDENILYLESLAELTGI